MTISIRPWSPPSPNASSGPQVAGFSLAVRFFFSKAEKRRPAAYGLRSKAFERGNGRVGFACIRLLSKRTHAREASEPPCLEPFALLVRF